MIFLLPHLRDAWLQNAFQYKKMQDFAIHLNDYLMPNEGGNIVLLEQSRNKENETNGMGQWSLAWHWKKMQSLWIKYVQCALKQPNLHIVENQ